MPFERSRRSEILILMNAGTPNDPWDDYRRHIDHDGKAALPAFRNRPSDSRAKSARGYAFYGRVRRDRSANDSSR